MNTLVRSIYPLLTSHLLLRKMAIPPRSSITRAISSMKNIDIIIQDNMLTVLAN